MKIAITDLKKCARLVTFLALVSFFATACSKKNDPAPKPDTPPPVTVPFGTVITVTDLMADTSDADPTSENRNPLFYSLEQNKEIATLYSKTALWDLSFTSIYNSFLGGNNGFDQNNQGYGGPGKGGIYILKQEFDAVKTIPPDSLFVTKGGAYGTDDSGNFGTGTGWYLYDFGGSLYPGVANKQHVAYPIADRTLVVRTANGNYAKIKMISIYKDITNPDSMFTFSPHPYYTFQYMLAKKGSTTFN